MPIRQWHTALLAVNMSRPEPVPDIFLNKKTQGRPAEAIVPASS